MKKLSTLESKITSNDIVMEKFLDFCREEDIDSRHNVRQVLETLNRDQRKKLYAKVTGRSH